MQDTFLARPNRGRLFTVIIGALLITGCNYKPLAPDSWFFVNDETHPNIIREGGVFFLKYAIQSVSAAETSKPIFFRFNYSQINWNFFDSISDKCDLGPNTEIGKECFGSVIRSEVVTESKVQKGQRREGKIRIGIDSVGKECHPLLECSGSVTMSFHNGSVNVHQTIIWQETQTGNKKDLIVK